MIQLQIYMLIKFNLHDMIYLGQDTATVIENGVKIVLDHPGGGSAQSLSYKPKKELKY